MYNPNSWDAEAGRIMSSRSTSAIKQDPSQKNFKKMKEESKENGRVMNSSLVTFPCKSNNHDLKY
jgi:hypothetical protein